jgi:hypothetical protein
MTTPSPGDLRPIPAETPDAVVGRSPRAVLIDALATGLLRLLAQPAGDATTVHTDRAPRVQSA